MAKNIEMKRLNGSGEYEPLYPKTLARNTIISNETATEIGVSVGSTVDDALMNKENTLPIGTIVPSIFDLGAKYLPIGTQGSKVKVEDYPKLYELLNEEQLTSGWVKVDTYNSSTTTSYEYYIDCIDGFYWVGRKSGSNYHLGYKKNLGESEWTSITFPSVLQGSSGDINLVKYMNGIWFCCGCAHRSSCDWAYVFYASSQEIINGTWHQLSQIKCNHDINDYIGYPSHVVKYFFAEYINGCYVFGLREDYTEPHKWCFHCYSLINSNNTPEFILFYSSTAYGDQSPYPQLFGANGYWYCYYFDETNKKMGVYGADSFNGLQNIAKYTINSINSSPTIEYRKVTRLLEDVGEKIFFEYNNQQYYFYTLTGAHSSKNPLADFQYNSEQLIVDKNLERVNNNYYCVLKKSTVLYSKSCYEELKTALIDSTISKQVLAFNYIDGIGYVILNDGIYINKNDLFDLPYAPSSYPLVYYIRAK